MDLANEGTIARWEISGNRHVLYIYDRIFYSNHCYTSYITLKDIVLTIEPSGLLASIKTDYPALAMQYKRFEPFKNQSYSGEKALLELIYTQGLGIVDRVRTKLLSLNSNIFISKLS